jgi:hypothetical protein
VVAQVRLEDAAETVRNSSAKPDRGKSGMTSERGWLGGTVHSSRSVVFVLNFTQARIDIEGFKTKSVYLPAFSRRSGEIAKKEQHARVTKRLKTIFGNSGS